MAGDTTFTEEIQQFSDSYSEENLLRRYARGRARHFLTRWVLNMVIAGTIGLLLNPWVGVFCFLVLNASEIAEHVVLLQVDDWLKKGEDFDRVSGHVTIVGACQALAISASITGAVCLSGRHDLGFFAAAFLSGAAMNAGLYLPFHRRGTLVKLWIYTLTLPPLIWLILMGARDFADAVFLLIGTIIMASMIYGLVAFIWDYHKRIRRFETALVNSGQKLATTIIELEAAQRESRTLAKVAENAMDSIIMSEPDGKIRWVNKAFTRTTGYTLEEVVGRMPGDVLNGPDTDPEVLQKIAEVRSLGNVAHVEICNYHKAGHKIWMDTVIVPIKDEAGDIEMVVGIERDVTKVRAQSEELEQTRIATEAATRSQAEFFSVMSNEVCAPIDAISRLAAGLATEGTDAHRQTSRQIEENAAALLAIITAILDSSQIDCGRLELVRKPFSLQRAVKSCVDMLLPSAVNKRLDVHLLGVEDLPEYALGDAARLRQILSNVIDNAIKFTDRGNVTITAACRDADDRLALTFSVSDSGPGIAPDQLGRIFDKYARGEMEGGSGPLGLGLGLSISRKLAQQMSGTITARSRPGQGSVFEITVRLERAKRAPQALNKYCDLRARPTKNRDNPERGQRETG